MRRITQRGWSVSHDWLIAAPKQYEDSDWKVTDESLIKMYVSKARAQFTS